MFERPIREDVAFRLRENSHKRHTTELHQTHTLVKLDLKTRTLLSQKPSDCLSSDAESFSPGLQKSQQKSKSCL